MKKHHFIGKPMLLLVGITGNLVLTSVSAICLVCNLFLNLSFRKRHRSDDVGTRNDDTPAPSVRTDYIGMMNKAQIRTYSRINENAMPYSAGTGRSVRDMEFMDLVEQVLERNATDPEYSVTKLCSDLNMERSGVYKTIHRNTGLSPSEYLSRRRCDIASVIITENPETPDDEVAAKSGFSSVHSMRLQFAKNMDMTYDIFRNTILNKGVADDSDLSKSSKFASE